MVICLEVRWLVVVVVADFTKIGGTFIYRLIVFGMESVIKCNAASAAAARTDGGL